MSRPRTPIITDPALLETTSKSCSICGRSKSLAHFSPGSGRYGRRAGCLLCTRIAASVYRQSPRGRKVAKAYNRSKAGKASQARYLATHGETRAAVRRHYQQSMRGRLGLARRDARRYLRKAKTDEQRRHWQAKLETVQREIERWEARRARDRAAEAEEIVVAPGTTVRRCTTWTPADLVRLAELHAAGLSWVAIGERLGRTPEAVEKRAREVGITGKRRTA